MKKKGFTLIEMLVVIVLIGVVIGISMPSVRKLTYTNKKRRYDQLEQMVGEAVKLYVKSHRGIMENSSKDCFSIQYAVLLKEGYIEEEDLSCTGNIVAERTNDGKGYNYHFYLTCRDKHGNILHEPTESEPLTCELLSGNFIIDYDLYEDSTMTKMYREGTWEKYVYGKYAVENPYDTTIAKYEYSKDLINWQTLNPSHQEYTDYKGDIYVRAVDSAGCISNINNHIVWADSTGPTFSLKSNEHEIVDGNTIMVSINDVRDASNGIGIDDGGYMYSFDNGNTWVNKTSSLLAIDTTANILVKDRLANTTTYPVKTIYACSDNKSGSATTAEILSDRTAWVDGKLVTGTMINQGTKNATLTAGSSYTIPEGYHDGNGKVTADGLASQTKATATALDISSGKTAWVNGIQITGTNTGNTMILVKSVDDSCNDGCSVDLKTYSKNNYKEFTIDNFFLQNVKSDSKCTSSGITTNPFHLSYDASTGILTIKNSTTTDECVMESSGDIYLFCNQDDCVNPN